MAIVLGALFGLCLLLLLLVLSVNGILILKSKLHHTSTRSKQEYYSNINDSKILIISDDTAVNEVMTVQSTSAYETIQLNEREQDGQYTDVGSGTTTLQHAYDTIFITPPEPQYQVPDNHHYASVTYRLTDPGRA